MRICVAVHRLRWQALDPRVFQSGCYHECGCTFADEDVTPATMGKGGQALPYSDGSNNTCGPESWNATVSEAAVVARTAGKLIFDDLDKDIRSAMDDGSARVGPAPAKDWVLRHFACTGDTPSKATHMGALLEAFYSNGTAQIKWRGAEPSPGPCGSADGGEGLVAGGGASGGVGQQQQQQQEAPHDERRHRLGRQRFRHRHDRKLRHLQTRTAEAVLRTDGGIP